MRNKINELNEQLLKDLFTLQIHDRREYDFSIVYYQKNASRRDCNENEVLRELIAGVVSNDKGFGIFSHMWNILFCFSTQHAQLGCGSDNYARFEMSLGIDHMEFDH